MRFLLGLVVGVLLTVGSAYVFDSTRGAEGEDAAKRRQMVNWDVVEAELKTLSVQIGDGWSRLTGHKDG